MCGNSYVEGCPCAQSAAAFNEDRERQARFSVVEHQVLALLRGEPIDASPRARAFAALLDGADVTDILATDGGIYFWTNGDGAQHHARLDVHPALRLAA